MSLRLATRKSVRSSAPIAATMSAGAASTAAFQPAAPGSTRAGQDCCQEFQHACGSVGFLAALRGSRASFRRALPWVSTPVCQHVEQKPCRRSSSNSRSAHRQAINSTALFGRWWILFTPPGNFQKTNSFDVREQFLGTHPDSSRRIAATRVVSALGGHYLGCQPRQQKPGQQIGVQRDHGTFRAFSRALMAASVLAELRCLRPGLARQPDTSPSVVAASGTTGRNRISPSR